MQVDPAHHHRIICRPHPFGHLHAGLACEMHYRIYYQECAEGMLVNVALQIYIPQDFELESSKLVLTVCECTRGFTWVVQRQPNNSYSTESSAERRAYALHCL